jgi:hypothetical protein
MTKFFFLKAPFVFCTIPGKRLTQHQRPIYMAQIQERNLPCSMKSHLPTPSYLYQYISFNQSAFRYATLMSCTLTTYSYFCNLINQLIDKISNHQQSKRGWSGRPRASLPRRSSGATSTFRLIILINQYDVFTCSSSFA